MIGPDRRTSISRRRILHAFSIGGAGIALAGHFPAYTMQAARAAAETPALLPLNRFPRMVQEFSRIPVLAISVGLLAAILHAQSPREITFDDIVRPKPGEWPSYNGHLSGNRHSPLDQINTPNVARLAPMWTHEMGGKRALQMTPLVVDGVMYVTAVNEVRALDARTGKQIWQFSRPQTPGWFRRETRRPASTAASPCSAIASSSRPTTRTCSRSIGSTGQLLWDVEMADYRQNYGATGAPLVVNDLVIAGISGGDEGVRGFLDAYRASTGERVWRFWTVPARGEPGSETWIGKALEHGCAPRG